MRIARALLFGLGLLALIAVVAWWLIEPELRARAADGLGSDVTIGRLRPAASGLSVRDVSFADRARGIELRVDSTVVSPSLSSLSRLLDGGSLLVSAVRFRGVDVLLSGRKFGSAEELRRFLPGGRRLLTFTGLRVDELRKMGLEVTDDALVTFNEVRMWHLDDETGNRTLVHEEPRLVFRRAGETFVLDGDAYG